MHNSEKGIFQRTTLLFGEDKMQLLEQKKVIIFGVGGVGSWCAESLVRSGIVHLTLVDFDKICESNVNRQLHATTKTIGQFKVEVLKSRLLQINPNAVITAIQQVYNADTHDSFKIDEYHFIVDAIDSLVSKMHLIRMATKTDAIFISSMGAALKLDPSKIKVAEFWKVRGCPLAYIIRKRIRKGDLPAKPFLCIYSEELLENKGQPLCVESELPAVDEYGIRKAVTNGTVAHITAIFGFTIAGLIIQSVYNENNEQE